MKIKEFHFCTTRFIGLEKLRSTAWVIAYPTWDDCPSVFDGRFFVWQAKEAARIEARRERRA